MRDIERETRVFNARPRPYHSKGNCWLSLYSDKELFALHFRDATDFLEFAERVEQVAREAREHMAQNTEAVKP